MGHSGVTGSMRWQPVVWRISVEFARMTVEREEQEVEVLELCAGDSAIQSSSNLGPISPSTTSDECRVRTHSVSTRKKTQRKRRHTSRTSRRKMPPSTS